MDVSSLVQTAPLHSVAEYALHAVVSDRSAVMGGGVLDPMAGGGRKQPDGTTVGAPVVSQQLESGGRQRNLAVLAALATDAKNASGNIDVGDLKAGALHEAQATGVHRSQADAVDVDAHGVKTRHTLSRLSTTGFFSERGLATSRLFPSRPSTCW